MAFQQILRMSAADFEAYNPTLALDQIGIETDIRNGIETDTGLAKLGNGVTLWNDLPYWPPGSTKIYRALLTQTGTSAPVATVLENSLGGTVVWGYTSTGIYTATLSGAFTVNKTWPLAVVGEAGNGYLGSLERTSANVCTLRTFDVSNSPADWAGFASVVILVYPA